MEHKDIGRAEAKQNQRMTHKAIFQPPKRALGAVFLNRQRHHITNAAMIQITRMGMVHGMGVSPIFIRGHGDDPNQAANPCVECARIEHRPMPAIMLNDEETNQHESACNHAKRNQKPAQRGQINCACKTSDKKAKGENKFKNSAGIAGLSILRQALGPNPFCGFCRFSCRSRSIRRDRRCGVCRV